MPDIVKVNETVSQLKKGFSLLTVLRLALDKGGMYEEGISQDVIEGCANIAFQAEENIGSALIDLEKILKEQSNKGVSND